MLIGDSRAELVAVQSWGCRTESECFQGVLWWNTQKPARHFAGHDDNFIYSVQKYEVSCRDRHCYYTCYFSTNNNNHQYSLIKCIIMEKHAQSNQQGKS